MPSAMTTMFGSGQGLQARRKVRPYMLSVMHDLLPIISGVMRWRWPPIRTYMRD